MKEQAGVTVSLRSYQQGLRCSEEPVTEQEFLAGGEPWLRDCPGGARDRTTFAQRQCTLVVALVTWV